jgi:hypothetical protein
LIWVIGLWSIVVMADSLVPLARLVGLVKAAKPKWSRNWQEQRRVGIAKINNIKPTVDDAKHNANPTTDVVYDDAGNNLNIYNLSNFKNCLTKELMINVTTVACHVSISLAHQLETGVDWFPDPSHWHNISKPSTRTPLVVSPIFWLPMSWRPPPRWHASTAPPPSWAWDIGRSVTSHVLIMY